MMQEKDRRGREREENKGRAFIRDQ